MHTRYNNMTNNNNCDSSWGPTANYLAGALTVPQNLELKRSLLHIDYTHLVLCVCMCWCVCLLDIYVNPSNNNTLSCALCHSRTFGSVRLSLVGLTLSARSRHDTVGSNVPQLYRHTYILIPSLWVGITSKVLNMQVIRSTLYGWKERSRAGKFYGLINCWKSAKKFLLFCKDSICFTICYIHFIIYNIYFTIYYIDLIGLYICIYTIFY